MKLNIQQFGGRGASSNINHNFKIHTMEQGNFEGQTYKTKLIRNNSGQVTGELNYVINSDGEAMVRMIKVYDQYKRQGYATKLLRDLQKEVGDRDINFDMLTDDGKALINKIGIITQERKGVYGVSHYKGRIKLK